MCLGLSLLTWLLWLVSSSLLLAYAFMLGDSLFICVQIINITAIVATIILARRANTVCPLHLGGGGSACDWNIRKQVNCELFCWWSHDRNG
jgi:hypothetical protein